MSRCAPSAAAVCRLAGTVGLAVGSSLCQSSALTPPPCAAPPFAPPYPSGAMHAGFPALSEQQPATK